MTEAFTSYAVAALADVITGGSANDQNPLSVQPIGLYRSGYQLEEFMRECGVSFRVEGSRVPSIRNKLNELLFIDPTGKDIARMIEHVADPRAYISEPKKGDAVIDHLNKSLEADGYRVSVVRGKARLQKIASDSAVIATFGSKAKVLDFDTVTREIDRALSNAETDPEDAVTAACSILESVCRSILTDMGEGLPDKKDISGLMKALQGVLGLSPARTDLPADVAEDIRKVLGGLTTTAKSIGALRTHGGDAHGRERGRKSVDARIARLAIHSASTISLFLIETWERQKRLKSSASSGGG